MRRTCRADGGAQALGAVQDVRDEDCERANRGWRRFLWLNLVTGFLVTMLLIAVAHA